MQIRAMLSGSNRAAPTLPAEAELEEAVGVMVREDIGALVIMDNGRISGILTRGDILRCLRKSAWDQALATPVKQVMSPKPFVTGSDEVVHTAVTRMQAGGIGHLPVIDKGELAGLLSITELLDYQNGEQRKEIAHLHDYIETLQNAEHD